METTFKNKKSINKNLNPFVILLFLILAIYSLSLVFVLVWGFITSLKNVADFEGYTDKANVLGLPRLEYWIEYVRDEYGRYVIDPETGERVTKPLSIFTNYVSVFKFFMGATAEDPVGNFWTGGSVAANKYYYLGLYLQKPVMEDGYASFFDLLANTILYTVGGALIIALVPAIVGYLCAKYPYKFSSLCYTITVVVMILPLVSSTPARITFLKRIYLFDTIVGDWIVNMTFTNMYFLVFYGFFQGMSGTYAEAAEVDGASQFRTLVTIIMPLAVKMMTTVILIYFIARWNDYNTPLMYLPSKPTIALAIYKLANSTNSGGGAFSAIPARIAAAMFVAIPMVILFICLKDKLLGNISMGGLKE